MSNKEELMAERMVSALESMSDELKEIRDALREVNKKLPPILSGETGPG